MKKYLGLTFGVVLLLSGALALAGPVPAHACGYGDYGYMNNHPMGYGQMGSGQMGPGQMAYGHGGPGGQFHGPGTMPDNMVRPPDRPQRPPQAAPAPGITHNHQQ